MNRDYPAGKIITKKNIKDGTIEFNEEQLFLFLKNKEFALRLDGEFKGSGFILPQLEKKNENRWDIIRDSDGFLILVPSIIKERSGVR